jgi:hypothetical protein
VLSTIRAGESHPFAPHFHARKLRLIATLVRIASTTPPFPPGVPPTGPVDAIEGYKWELYNDDVDPTQSNNLVRVP